MYWLPLTRVTPHSVGRCLRKQTEGTAAVSGWVIDPEGEKKFGCYTSNVLAE